MNAQRWKRRAFTEVGRRAEGDRWRVGSMWTGKGNQAEHSLTKAILVFTSTQQRSTYMGASSRAGYGYPPAPDHRGPHTSSSQFHGGTGWVHNAHTHHTGVQTCPAGAAGRLPPLLLQGCALVPVDTGFSPPLSTSKAECQWGLTQCSQCHMSDLDHKGALSSLEFVHLKPHYERQGCSSVGEVTA